MKKTVPSNRMYIVPPRAIGLTRSPPGVMAAAKMAIPRMMTRRAPRQPCRGHDADPRQPVQQDRELHDQAEGQEHRGDEVEVGSGRQVGDEHVVGEARAGSRRRTAG